MNTDENARFDWTGKEMPISVDAPVEVTFHPETGSLVVRSTQLHPAVKGGITMALHFSPQAASQLMAALRQIETTQGMPIGSPTTQSRLQ